MKITVKFLSTPSARRATHSYPQSNRMLRISIHALREEGDTPSSTEFIPPKDFYPRPPRGGRPDELGELITNREISIHALREEGDTGSEENQRPERISIHALREEGDSKNRDKISIFL